MGKVHQRPKNGPVTFTGVVKLFSKDIEMKIKAPAETWRELVDVDFEDPSLISNAFYNGVIREVINFLKSKKARGIHADRVEFTKIMKRYCAYIYCICEYWLKKPRQEWPDPIKEAVDLLETPFNKRQKDISIIAGELTLISDHTQTIKKPTAPTLTAFFAEKYFHTERRKNGFKKWSDNFGTFRRTFITNNKRYIKHYEKKILPLLFRRLKKYNRFRKHKMTLPFNTGDLPEIFETMKKSSPGIK